jgi:hypothetical protein
VKGLSLSALGARRGAAILGAAAVALVSAPALAPNAFATTALQPAFTSSYFWAGGDITSFPTVAGRADQSVQTGTRIYVEFNGPVKVVQQSGSPLVSSNDVSGSSYLLNTATNAKTFGTTTPNPNGNDADLLEFTVPAFPADGTYKLHLTALNAASCPDGSTTNVVSLPACTGGFDDFVASSGAPFAFRYDATPPTGTLDVVNGGNPVTASGITHVALSGTADGDTKSLSVSIKGPGILGTYPLGAASLSSFASDAEPRTWSVSGDLADLPNGTFTVVLTVVDIAGNKGTYSPEQTFTLAAHPTAPRHVTVKTADAAGTLHWQPPASTGGSPVTKYFATADDLTTTSDSPVIWHQFCNGSVCPSSHKFTGLTNGHRYAFSVFAITTVGNGDPASVDATPRWATTLTVLGPKTVRPKRVDLTGRLSRTSNGAAVKNATLTVTPHYGTATGKPFTVTTDMFGTWYHRLWVRGDVTFVAKFAGDRADQPSTGRHHIDVANDLPSTG